MATQSTHQKKSILITGCSTGIGLAAAQHLHDNNYRVITSVRNVDDIAKLEQLGFECIHLDLRSEDSIDAAVDYIHENAPDLFGLVNNGAYGQPGAVEDLTRAALEEQFQTNVLGTHSLTRKLIPIFRKHNEGRIVQISSILGFVGAPMRGAYNASKFALEGLSDTMRIELSDTNIKVALIEPGPIESDFKPNAYKAFAKHIDIENSHFSELYKEVEVRLNSKKKARFTLPALDVAKQILHAIESPNPKVRYWITIPTIIMGVLTKILPAKIRDKIILSQSS